MEKDEVLAQVWLSRVPMQNKLRRSLLGNIDAILNAYQLDPRGLRLTDLKDSLTQYKKQGIGVIVPSDDQYKRVFGSYQALGFDVPFLLYIKGNQSLLDKSGIAFVGSRQAPLYAQRVTQELVGGLQGLEACIISGGAQGVDTKAHEVAMGRGLSTICVLGCGIGYDYPALNKRLFKRLGQEQLLISEYPPGTAPRRYQFPERNRIIAQLSKAVVVTSAGKLSGSLITAERAMELDHPVLTVPWPLFEPCGEGCNFLLETGAQLITSGQHLREHLIAFGLIKEEEIKGLDPEE